MKVLWFVRYGPDASHQWDAKFFDKLKDAREFAQSLPLTPTGGTRPFRIERFEYAKSEIYGDIVNILEVEL